jgi:hypothetical protein
MTLENKTKFTDYCIEKIEQAFSECKDEIELKFTESKDMCKLSYDEISSIYNGLKSHYFNKYAIDISFEGYNGGSYVPISYLTTGKYKDFPDMSKDAEFTKACEDLYLINKQTIDNLHPKLIPMFIRLNTGNIRVVGYQWDFMLYQASLKFQLLGWKIIRSEGNTYLMKL